MAKKKSPNLKDGREVTRHLKKNNIPIRNGSGSHRVATLPNGQKLVYHEHGEFKTGMRRKIEKVLRTAGLFLLVSASLFVWYLTL